MKLVPLTETFLSLTEKTTVPDKKQTLCYRDGEELVDLKKKKKKKKRERGRINLFMLSYKMYDVMVFTSRLIALFAHLYRGHRE